MKDSLGLLEVAGLLGAINRTFAALTIASDAVIAPSKPATSSNPSESFTMPPPDVYFC